MNEKDLGKKIIEKIEKKKIKPKPKWEFLLKDSVLWFFVVLTVIVGSLAFSIIIYMIDNNDWDLYDHFSDNYFGFILATLPYFWFIVLVLFLGLLFYNFKHTTGGYKYTTSTIMLSSILLSVILGVLFYNLGFAQEFEDLLADNVQPYKDLVKNREKVWTQPEKGVLAGKVVVIIDQNNFKIIDLNKNEWQVLASNLRQQKCPHIQEGIRIKIIGQKITNQQFEAHIIRPFFKEPPRIIPFGIRSQQFPVMVNCH